MRRGMTCLIALALGAGCGDDASDGGAPAAGSSGSSGQGAGGAGQGGAGSAGASGAAGGAEVPADPSAGCEPGEPVYAPGPTDAELTHGGRQRTFRVHVPPGAEPGKPLPLVLGLHGGGGSGKQFEQQSGLTAVADARGFIAVYPDGTGVLGTWNGGFCCGKAAEQDVDDVGFIAALLDEVGARACVDRARVFATGMSNGGIFSHRLGCELSDRIAAIAPTAGPLGVDSCAPGRPVPVMHTHGSLDAHAPFDGGVGCGFAGVPFPSVPDTMEGWRTRNGCGAATVAGFSQGDGSCAAYEGCGAPTVLCVIDGGGHSWPGGGPPKDIADCPADGAHSTTFVQSEAAWAFFRDNPRRP